jgi:hypothetical protein
MNEGRRLEGGKGGSQFRGSQCGQRRDKQSMFVFEEEKRREEVDAEKRMKRKEEEEQKKKTHDHDTRM